MKANRQALIAMSQEAKSLVEAGEYERINEALVAMHSEILGVSSDRESWNTFNGWKQAGKMVIKGEKGSTIWSRKRKAEAKDSEAEATATTKEKETAKAFSFFGVATIFHSSQVEEYTPKAKAKK